MRKAIEKAKKTLIKKAAEKGLYENFGQKEVRKLEDKFIDISDYSYSMNAKRSEIAGFCLWCMNYEG